MIEVISSAVPKSVGSASKLVSNDITSSTWWVGTVTCAVGKIIFNAASAELSAAAVEPPTSIVILNLFETEPEE